MIAYTDRPVPLAKLGSLAASSPANADKTGDQSGDNKEAEDQPQLALIECYKNAIGVSRKVDPVRPGDSAAAKDRGRRASGLRTSHRRFPRTRER